MRVDGMIEIKDVTNMINKSYGRMIELWMLK